MLGLVLMRLTVMVRFSPWNSTEFPCFKIIQLLQPIKCIVTHICPIFFTIGDSQLCMTFPSFSSA